MQLLAFVVYLLCVASAARFPLNRQHRTEGRIVGGTDADIRDFPWQCSLRTLGRHLCGCSIISDQYLLTAAHCTDGWSSLSVRCGTNSTAEGGQVALVTKVIQHEQYNSQTYDYDISLLEANVSNIPIAKAVPLPNGGCDIGAGTPCIATGWGDLSENGASTTKLQKVTLPIVATTSCNDSYDGAITERMICAGYDQGEKDTCQGDSGGPLVSSSGEQVGIVSWGRGCARPGFPGIYTCVGYFLDWITSNADV